MIYLLRHGLDDENFIGGWSDVDLIPEGINQVKDAAIYIKKHLNISKIYSSDVKRAITTSTIISDATNLEVLYTQDLRELDKGKLTGMEKKLAKEFYPQYFINLDIFTRYPDGESMIDLYKRIKHMLENISIYENCLLVTHRGVINMLYFLLNNSLPDLNKKRFNVVHASIHELDNSKRLIKRIK